MFHGRDLNASTPLWQHDNPWIRRPSRAVRSSWKFAVFSFELILGIAIALGELAVTPRRKRLMKRILILPSFNFLTLQYIYFITTSLVSSVIFWRTADSSHPIDYTDALFTCVSAMAGTGLRTVCLDS